MPKPGERVFLKRRARHQLRSYWGHRWDALDIRREILRHDRPRYFVDTVHLDGLYVQLRRLPFLWYAGVLTIGRHLAPRTPDQRPRWVQEPVHLPLRGLGPRVLVFPPTILDQLGDLPLLGNAYRYTGQGSWRTRRRVRMQVDRLVIGTPDPLFARFGTRLGVHQTLCLQGTTDHAAEESHVLNVPISEVYWKSLIESPTRG
ncbi:MAG: hypothetical protein AAF602_13720 [Myxococcota bacterium]